jgi:hypothetical protein
MRDHSQLTDSSSNYILLTKEGGSAVEYRNHIITSSSGDTLLPRINYSLNFPFVVPECGYKGAKEAVSHAASKISVSPSDLEWILGKTVSQLFQGAWVAP